MKHRLKIVLCIVLALGVLLGISACGNSQEATTADTKVKQYIVGRYNIEKIEWEDGTVASDETLQDAEDAMGEMYVELFDDGTAQLSLLGQINDMEFSDDKMWQIDYSNNSYDFSVGNGKVTLTKAGDTYTFAKE